MNWKFSTAGGMATVIFANIHSSDLVKTAILAAIGAAVSFIMTWLLNKMTKRGSKKAS
jgi:hypothetical protein